MLNNDCLSYLFAFFNRLEKLNLAKVCKQWNDLVSKLKCWKSLNQSIISNCDEDDRYPPPKDLFGNVLFRWYIVNYNVCVSCLRLEGVLENFGAWREIYICSSCFESDCPFSLIDIRTAIKKYNLKEKHLQRIAIDKFHRGLFSRQYVMRFQVRNVLLEFPKTDILTKSKKKKGRGKK